MRGDEIYAYQWRKRNRDGIYILNLHKEKAGIRQNFNVKLRFKFNKFVQKIK